MNLEKVGYNIGRTVTKFKCWNVPMWIKILTGLGTLALVYGVFYLSYMLAPLLIAAVVLTFILNYDPPEVYHLRKLREEVAGFKDDLQKNNQR